MHYLDVEMTQNAGIRRVQLLFPFEMSHHFAGMVDRIEAWAAEVDPPFTPPQIDGGGSSAVGRVMLSPKGAAVIRAVGRVPIGIDVWELQRDVADGSASVQRIESEWIDRGVLWARGIAPHRRTTISSSMKR